MKLEDSEDEHQVYGRIVGIKSLLMLLGVNTAKLMLLVEKVNAAGMEVTTAKRLQLLKDYNCLKSFYCQKDKDEDCLSRLLMG
ncbi:hypothetical protein Tco_1324402 [Tanacetum coccineum]